MALDVHRVTPGLNRPETDSWTGFGLQRGFDGIEELSAKSPGAFPLLTRLDPYGDLALHGSDILRLVDEIDRALPRLTRHEEATAELSRLREICHLAQEQGKSVLFFGD